MNKNIFHVKNFKFDKDHNNINHFYNIPFKWTCDQFEFYFNELLDMRNFPIEINTMFIDGNLLSDVGGPKIVKEKFKARHIASLEGWNPEYVKNLDLDDYNNLENLKGFPKKIDGDFRMVGNSKLKSLEGMPKSIKGIFRFDLNDNIKNLDDMPLYAKKAYINSNNILPDEYVHLEGYEKLCHHWDDDTHKTLLKELFRKNPGLISYIEIPDRFKDIKEEFNSISKSDEYGLFESFKS